MKQQLFQKFHLNCKRRPFSIFFSLKFSLLSIILLLVQHFLRLYYIQYSFKISNPMSYQKESFGMMDEGYFVPRTQIVDWINKLLDLNITKIQMLGAGSIYCQIVDVIHPGKVAMNKVNWKAKSDYEFIINLKILQTAFDKAGVKRYVQVQKLAKAKYQDNLQFIQWLKRYYDLNCGDRGNDYNPNQRRGNVKTDFSFAQKNIVPKTFNGGGQIAPKTNMDPPKKVQAKLQTKLQPKQPKQFKQPVVVVKKTTIVGNKTSVVQRKPQMRPATSTKAKREQQIKPVAQKPDNKKLQRYQVEPGQVWKEKYAQLQKKNKDLAQKYNDLDMKVAMAKQILASDDSSEMKLKFLQEILQVGKPVTVSTHTQEYHNQQTHYEQQEEQQVQTHQIAIGNDQNQQNYEEHENQVHHDEDQTI